MMSPEKDSIPRFAAAALSLVCVLLIAGISAAAGLSLTRQSASGCSLNDNLFVLTHPWFAQKYWVTSTQTTTVELPEDLCTLHPLTFYTSRHERFNVSAFISDANRLYIMKSEHYLPDCACCIPKVVFNSPREVAVPHITLSLSTPVFVLSESRADADTARILLPIANLRIEMLTVITSNGSISKHDTITLSEQAGGQAIRGISSDRSGYSDNTLWITGTGGMIRSIPVTGSSFGAEVVHDIDASQQVLCYGDGLLGTASGAVYRYQAGNFSLANAATGIPLRFISSTVAAGDNGQVLVFYNNVWQARTIGTLPFVFGHLTADTNGTVVELLDQNWGYRTATIGDSPTRIDSLYPAGLMDSINGGSVPFEYLNPPFDTLVIKLTDIDNNIEPPVVRIGHVGGSPGVFPDYSRLSTRDPSMRCTEGLRVFAVDTLLSPWRTVSTMKVVGQAASVTIQVPARYAQPDIFCGTCVWESTTFQATSGWARDDTLVIAASSDTLRILHAGGGSVHIPALSNTTHPGISRAWCPPASSQIIIDLPSDGMARIDKVALYDLTGRMIAQVQVPAGTTRLTLPRPRASSLAQVRFFHVNGSVTGAVVPLVR